MAAPNIDTTSTLLGILIAVITIISAIAAFFRKKWNQSLAAAKHTILTSSDIEKITHRIDDLSEEIDDIREKMEREIISGKEEHTQMQVKYQELIKELYKLIGQVTALKEKD